MSLAKNSVRLILPLLLISCVSASLESISIEGDPGIEQQEESSSLKVGAERTVQYLSLLQDRTVAIVANHTSVIGNSHLVDSLLSLGVDVKHVYAPEHGFRGDQDAGAHIEDEKDVKTGLPIYSLHGKSKKPSAESLQGIDVMAFDIQDVGARFYTYISTLHYVMEACAENDISLIVLDRPNPHAHYTDGPVLEEEFSSFVGMHPVPVVYGLTIGEYAGMINGEGWLSDGIQCDLTVIKCEGYDRNEEYVLAIPPSPNLPNQASIQLYPSLCLFEGTVVSVGRGTDHPFQIVGHPDFGLGSYSFTPQPNYGSKYPKLEGKQCFGQFLGENAGKAIYEGNGLEMSYLYGYHQFLSEKMDFFSAPDFFDKLAGTDKLRIQLTEGQTEVEIKESWKKGLEEFETVRAKYLLYL